MRATHFREVNTYYAHLRLRVVLEELGLIGVLLTCLLIVWIYALTVLYRAKLGFWYYVTGSVGFFTFAMIFIEPLAVPILQKQVAAVAGIFGELTGMYDSYFKAGILFISHNSTNLSLYIDFECSGVIEILAFLSLLIFFKVYSHYERVVVGLMGTLLAEDNHYCEQERNQQHYRKNDARNHEAHR